MSQLHFAVLDFGVSHLTTREIKEKLPGIKRVGLVDQRLKKLPALMQTGWDDCSKFAEHILAAARQAVDPAPATRFRPQVFVFSLDASEELLREAMGPQVICAFTATAAEYHSRMHAMHQLDMVSGLIDGLQRCSSNDPTFARISQELELSKQEKTTITMHPALVQAMMDDYRVVEQRLAQPLKKWLNPGWGPALAKRVTIKPHEYATNAPTHASTQPSSILP